MLLFSEDYAVIVNFKKTKKTMCMCVGSVMYKAYLT